MKAFQKLALVSAIALTSTAFAMEVADDETLASATGQDGITIAIAPGTRNAAQLTGLGVDLLSAGLDLDLAINGGNADGVYKGLSITQTVIHDDDGLNTLGPPIIHSQFHPKDFNYWANYSMILSSYITFGTSYRVKLSKLSKSCCLFGRESFGNTALFDCLGNL